MKLGLRLATHSADRLDIPVNLIRRAEEVGFHSVWTAETYGADAFTPLVVAALNTTRIALATGIAQIAARPPATLAMQAMSLDAVAGGGRVIVGVGLSGPQVVEGWYGQPWGRPAIRLRDYVTILRSILDRAGPASHPGAEVAFPYRGPGATGARPLKSILRPSCRIPIWIGCDGPRNVETCAELADGWLPTALDQRGIAPYADTLAAGFARRDPADVDRPFDVFRHLDVVVTNDVAAEMTRLRHHAAFYVGGMGSATHNFHRDAMARRGFPDEAATIGALWSAGRKDEAAAAVPDEYIEQSALVGSKSRVTQLWNEGGFPGVTGVTVATNQIEAIDLMADIAGE